MKLYVIKDIESGLYVTRGNVPRLDSLGVNTRLFSSQSEAMKTIESKINPELGEDVTWLQNDLAWDLLEKVYEIDRWHINCGIEELKDAIEKFKNLKAVPLWLEEVN